MELKIHIENHPNFNVVKNEKWHIDHIFPIKAFIDHNIWDVKIINALENLQPLVAKDNCSKRAKYDKLEFNKYLERMNER